MNARPKICFIKAVASGNDFIIIDNKNGELNSQNLDYSKIAQDVCQRKLSIGADGLLVLEGSNNAVFKMRIFNPDGSEVDMCGNGLRCSALYASVSGWGDNLTIETGAGILSAACNADTVKLKMSDPKDIKLDINLGVDSLILKVHHINTGVPHVVHLVEDLEKYDVVGIGLKIREHKVFAPAGTNVDFVSDIESSYARVRTYERGVEDETLACGTGITASAVILGLLKHVTSPVTLRTESGEKVIVYFKIDGRKVTDVYLEGKARIVCEGKF
ncbi:MAG: diaminopimelate epimerase [Candidatus Omnitrophica bacterium]|nr:diaminopimelate epimerase [Candidatus Omnitrophota bacterium]MBU1894492.1 diaminopimelate epimerase [Candidatus Omnitrophota bacterium]